MLSGTKVVSLGITAIIVIVIVLVLGFGVYLNDALNSSTVTVTLASTSQGNSSTGFTGANPLASSTTSNYLSNFTSTTRVNTSNLTTLTIVITTTINSRGTQYTTSTGCPGPYFGSEYTANNTISTQYAPYGIAFESERTFRC